jgi:nucleoside-diphosphate-sugar epimerase
MRIALTGSEGLIGRALAAALTARGDLVRRLDVRAPEGDEARGDVRDAERVARLVEGCDGVVHLAAVSRVIWGEREPERCVAVNEGGTRNVLAAALAAASRPWVLFSSSREVYGEAARLPVDEDTPVRPVNVYGRTKAVGEALSLEARGRGLRTAVLRFSNVYGSVLDHADRVVPAFCRGAALGHALRVDGPLHTFDFTHLDDTVDGVVRAVDALAAGVSDLPPVHLLPGVPTTLGQLAVMAAAAGGWRSAIHEAPSRNFDVARFCGDPRRARELLGWSARTPIARGVEDFVRAFADDARARPGGA